MPAPELQSDIIAITGLAANLDRAKMGLLDRVKELQAEQEDRVSRTRPPAWAGVGNSLVQSMLQTARCRAVVGIRWSCHGKRKAELRVSLTPQIKRNIWIYQLLQTGRKIVPPHRDK